MKWNQDKINRGRVKKLFIFTVKLFGYIIWKLSCMFPRTKKKWLLGDVMGFSGNTKYVLLDFIRENEKNKFRLIWITHDKKLIPQIQKFGIDVFYWLSLRGIWHSLTAGCYIVTSNTIDINCYLSGKAYYFNFWHGIGLKAVCRQSQEWLKVSPEKRENFYYRVLFFYWAFRLPNICLTTSEFMLRNIFMKQFELPEDKFILGMYPRTSFMLKPLKEILAFAERFCQEEQYKFIGTLDNYRKVYIYMPTWRDNGKNIVEEASIDFCLLNESLKTHNDLFLFKFHSKTKINIEEIEKYEQLRIIDTTWDIYPILPFTDCLITDYSSIYSEYMLMNKEIIIFEYDKKSMNENRGLPPYFEDKTPGIRITEFSQLLNLISSSTDCHLSKEDMDNVLETYWSARDLKLDFYEEIRKRLFD